MVTSANAAAKLDEILLPGSEVTVSFEEAGILGAFQEDAISYQDAKDSRGE